MNYMYIEKSSISNGTGVRVVLWVSGCNVKCKGCFNKETWDFNAGKEFNEAAKNKLFFLLDKPYVKGITISGGHPLEAQNLHPVCDLLNEIRAKFTNKDIWLYTGYTLSIEDFLNGDLKNVLLNCDIVVDGNFIIEQKDITLPFRGSRNQRIIDVRESIRRKQIINAEVE